MKKSIILLFFVVSLSAAAQAHFGYVSFDEIMKVMPEYATAQADLQALQQKCENELSTADKEFNKKYAEFIDGQSSFPEIIRDKRQKELQELMDKSIEFKKQVNKTMNDARRDMMQPLRERIKEAAKKVCTDNNLDFIIDSDKDVFLGINENQGTDVTAQMKAALGIATE